MNTAKFLKLAPTLILAGFLAYSSYSVQAILPSEAEERAEMSKGLDTMVQDILSSGNVAVGRLEGELRDPFQVRHKTVGPATSRVAAPSVPAVDSLADIVAGLKLDATLLQGRDHIAVIDGRIYSPGQHLRVDGDDGKSASPLVVTAVFSSKVILRGEGKTYVLAYPDRLGKRAGEGHGGGSRMSQDGAMADLDPGGQRALFQQLLNSPIGALGKGLLGNPALTDPASGSRAGPRTRRPQGARTSPSTAGPGNL